MSAEWRRYKTAHAESMAAAAEYAAAKREEDSRKIRAADARCARVDARTYAAADALRAVLGTDIPDEWPV